jgi:hypothetical protein
MTTMDIRGPNQPPPVPPPDPNQGPTGPAEKGSADFAKSMDQTGGAETARPLDAAATAGFDRMAPIIQGGVAENLSRQEILSRVVDAEAKHQFGDLATPEMTQALAEKFQSDPRLSSIFNGLYDRAAQAGRSGSEGSAP